MPNKIFDEGLTPNEFVVYSFLTKAKDKRNQSYWSVPHMAHYCGICDTTCRKVLSSLKEKGYIEISDDTEIMCSKAISIRSTEFNVPLP